MDSPGIRPPTKAVRGECYGHLAGDVRCGLGTRRMRDRGTHHRMLVAVRPVATSARSSADLVESDSPHARRRRPPRCVRRRQGRLDCVDLRTPVGTAEHRRRPSSHAAPSRTRLRPQTRGVHRAGRRRAHHTGFLAPIPAPGGGVMNHVVVIGGASILGLQLCRALLERGDRVTAIDAVGPVRAAALRDFGAHPRFAFRRANVTVPSTFARARADHPYRPCHPSRWCGQCPGRDDQGRADRHGGGVGSGCRAPGAHHHRLRCA